MVLFLGERTLIWNRYAAMLVAQSIITGTIGVLYTVKPVPYLLISVAAILGVVTALIWGMMTSIAWDYHKDLQKELQQYKVNHDGMDVKNITTVAGEGLKGFSVALIWLFGIFQVFILVTSFLRPV